MADGIRVTHILEATLGGTGRHLADVGCGLAAAGFAVEAVISLRRAEDFAPKAQRLAEAGVTLTEVPMARAIAPADDARALWRLYRHLRRSQPDLVHAHSSKAGILGRVAARWARVPVVVYSPHAFAFQMRSGYAPRTLYLRLERLAGRWTDCLVAVSHAEADLAAAAGLLPKARIAVIENGVDPAETVSRAEGAAVRQALGIAPQAPVVLFAARLVEQKAPEVLVRAALRVLERHPDAVFLLAGEGPLRPLLEQEIARANGEPNVRLLGYRPDAARLYAAADLFALPSRWEGLPYALLEAMAAGLPVVASDIPAIAEAAPCGETALLVPPDDPGALAEALECLIREPDDARALGAAGRERVRRCYTLDRQVARLGALYQRLCGFDVGAERPGASGWRR
ncbi:MAG: glycosyltransferase family 4 protein [Armatimonadetes bacterium]|nr:glycosyltransferase family 4 protein [Armatimonadota bacterium]